MNTNIAKEKEILEKRNSELYHEQISLGTQIGEEEGLIRTSDQVYQSLGKIDGLKTRLQQIYDRRLNIAKLEGLLRDGLAQENIEKYQELRESIGLGRLNEEEIANIMSYNNVVEQTKAPDIQPGEPSETPNEQGANSGTDDAQAQNLDNSMVPEPAQLLDDAENKEDPDDQKDEELDESITRSELKALDERLNTLAKLKEDKNLEAYGDVVDKIDAEYEALSQMRNLISAGLTEETMKVYLEERAKTSLPNLNDDAVEKMLKEAIAKDDLAVTLGEMHAIEERIKKLEEYKQNIQKAAIEGGDSIIEEIDKEHDALAKMREILKSGLTLDNVSQYLVERSKTKLDALGENDIEQMLSEKDKTIETSVTDKELKNIEERMEEIVKAKEDRILRNGTSDPELFNKLDSEYEALENMKAMLNAGLTTSDIQKYLDERRKTKLDPLEKGDLEKLLKEGKKIKNKNTTEQQEPDSSESPENDDDDKKDETPEEELDEVKKVSKWQWIKQWAGKHKKQILIALGLTALAIGITVALTQLLPAYFAASKAAEVAGLAGQMVTNSQLWATATASEQLALHGANTALASHISGLAGISNVFNPASGVWTLGTQALPAFSSSAAAAASAAAGKVGLITGGALVSGIGGLGLLGSGLLSFKKKSAKYKEIKKEIKQYYTDYEHMTPEEQAEKFEELKEKISASEELSDEEKKILLNRLKKALNELKQAKKDEEEKAAEKATKEKDEKDKEPESATPTEPAGDEPTEEEQNLEDPVEKDPELNNPDDMPIDPEETITAAEAEDILDWAEGKGKKM